MWDHNRKQRKIADFIFMKIQDNYTVSKISENTYQFKKKTKLLDITEKVHSDNFLNEFIKMKNLKMKN
jgi:hypothetical protein